MSKKKKGKKRAGLPDIEDAQKLMVRAEQDVEKMVRDGLTKAASIKDLREMWFTIRDILNLLTLLITPNPDVVLPDDVPAAP